MVKNPDHLGDLGAGNNNSLSWQPLIFLASGSRPSNDGGNNMGCVCLIALASVSCFPLGYSDGQGIG